MPGGARTFEDDFNPISRKQERREADADASVFLPTNEKENNTRENNVAKIKVVVCHLRHLSVASCLHFKTCRKVMVFLQFHCHKYAVTFELHFLFF